MSCVCTFAVHVHKGGAEAALRVLHCIGPELGLAAAALKKPCAVSTLMKASSGYN